MITWSLTIAGTTKTLSEWGVNGVSLRRANLAGDNLTFSAPRAGFDALLCAFGDTVTLLRDGVVWFTGTNQTIPDYADAAEQSQAYTIASPWRWLAENIFQQPWYGTTYTSHIIFVGSIGTNIKAVLDYAIAQGAPLAYLASDLTALSASPPTNEFTEKRCSHAILNNLQFAPDTVSWFDYTTTPPTLRFQQRGSLVATALRMADYENDDYLPVTVLDLRPRPDLQIPSAKINIEVIQEVDGAQILVPLVDVYPPGSTGREDRAFNGVLTVQGTSVTNVFGELECEAIDSTSVEWWKKHIPTLRDAGKINIVSGPTGVAHYDQDGGLLSTVYERELLPSGGSIAEWMSYNGTPLLWQREYIRATFRIREYADDGENVVKDEIKEYSVELVSTTAPAGHSEYSAVSSIDSGDPVPTGLAQYLYESLSELHYQGRLHLTEQECTAYVTVGNVINLFGARTAYESMRALVQEVSFHLDSGTTEITLGPPEHLSLSDVLALLTRFRVRRRYTNPDTQATGELSANEGEVTLGKASGNTNSIPGAGVDSYYRVISGTNQIKMNAPEGLLQMIGSTETSFQMSSLTNAGTINLVISEAGGRDIRIREIGVCVAGVNKKMLVVGSPIY